MKKRTGLIALLVLCAMVLCGCEFQSNVEDLFALPKMPEEFTGLNEQLEMLRAQGYEYAAPTAGENLQSMQMVDLDGDRQLEVVVFFRYEADEKPMKVFVYKLGEAGYERLCSVESSGSSIDRVVYQDLNGDGKSELIVGWKMATDVQTLAVYNIGREALPLMNGIYTRYTIEDINEDGLPELFVLRGDSNGTPTMEVYMWQTNILAVVQHCSLSSSMVELSRGSIVTGTTAERSSAVFVTGVTEKNMAVTDVLTWERDLLGGGSVVNAAMSEATGRSSLVEPYRQMQPQDINQDGITEIPAPEMFPAQGDTLVTWNQYSVMGHAYPVDMTYHALSNGWYFVLPQNWWARVSAATQETVPGENQVVLTVDGWPTVAIYTLTGENREARASMGERVLIRRQIGVVYAAELLEGAEMYGIDASVLRSNFHMIENQWLPSSR